jgi:hypothetical protein
MEKEKNPRLILQSERYIYTLSTLLMHPSANWLGAFALRVIPLGRRVVKRGARNYLYWYLRLDTARFPEAAHAYRLRLVVAPPDLSAPPAVITARVFQRGTRTVGFDVPKAFQPLLESYSRTGLIAVLGIEVIEKDKPLEAGGT